MLVLQILFWTACVTISFVGLMKIPTEAEQRDNVRQYLKTKRAEDYTKVIVQLNLVNEQVKLLNEAIVKSGIAIDRLIENIGLLTNAEGKFNGIQTTS